MWCGVVWCGVEHETRRAHRLIKTDRYRNRDRDRDRDGQSRETRGLDSRVIGKDVLVSIVIGIALCRRARGGLERPEEREREREKFTISLLL